MSWWSSLVETVRKDVGEFSTVVRTDANALVSDVLSGKGVSTDSVVGRILAREEGAGSEGSPSALSGGTAASAAHTPHAAAAAAVVARLQSSGEEEEDLSWGDADAEEASGEKAPQRAEGEAAARDEAEAAQAGGGSAAEAEAQHAAAAAGAVVVTPSGVAAAVGAPAAVEAPGGVSPAAPGGGEPVLTSAAPVADGQPAA